MSSAKQLSVVEICAGGGGQSLGLELAGFLHVAAVDNDIDSCCTLRRNRPNWHVREEDVADLDGRTLSGADLLAGGVPCPPFSVAGKQLGEQDERDLFPEALRLANQIKPRAILLENVRGFAATRFASYRAEIAAELERLNYVVQWKVLNAVEFGVPQYRPRFLLIGLRPDDHHYFSWPEQGRPALTVGESIVDLMGARGWPGVRAWKERANGHAPTLVGGSKKHGGPDLGPTRARAEWRKLGVEGRSIADLAPSPDFPTDALPRLTVRMAARVQGFPDEWLFAGSKTSSYKQVGNAFPPPVAMALGLSLQMALTRTTSRTAKQLSVSPGFSYTR